MSWVPGGNTLEDTLAGCPTWMEYVDLYDVSRRPE